MTNGSTHKSSYANRHAFTLVELLVVIVIIGILVGLLIPAIMSSMRRAKEAVISAEIGTITAAIENFRTTQNVGIPSDFSIGFDGPTTAYKINEVNRTLGRLFRYRDAQLDIPFNPYTNRRAEWQDLDVAEAWVFWLFGFCSDKSYPITGSQFQNGDSGPKPVMFLAADFSGTTGNFVVPPRTGGFEFKQEQLADRDRDGFPEYYPKNTKAPYVYYSNKNYRRVYLSAINGDLPVYWLNVDVPGGLTQPKDVEPQWAPLPYLAKNPNTMTEVVIRQDAFQQNFAEQTKYQILSAGLDGEYYSLGNEAAQIGQEFASYIFAEGPYSDKAHRDNITSFAGGTLESKKP